ncbi:MAG: VPLPA-CTERM sorting domain-containing protein [Thiogranum sp.]
MNNKIKNMIKSAPIVVVSMLAVAGVANAATVRINPDTLTVTNGSTFSLTVEGADFLTPTIGGGFAVTWDTAALTLVSTDAQIVASGEANGWFFTSATTTLPAPSPGIASLAVDVADFAPKSGLFDIITLDFTAVQPGVTNTDIGVLSSTPAWNDDNFGEIFPTYAGATITVETSPVPVPAAAWLFASGLLGMVGVARRQSASSLS